MPPRSKEVGKSSGNSFPPLTVKVQALGLPRSPQFFRRLGSGIDSRGVQGCWPGFSMTGILNYSRRSYLVFKLKALQHYTD